MKVDKDLISRIENLARLDLSEQERSQIGKDLNAILQMVKKLDELDTDNVDPLIHISESVNIFRKDEIRNQLDRAEALKNAPEKDDTYFKVPKVIDLKKANNSKLK